MRADASSENTGSSPYADELLRFAAERPHGAFFSSLERAFRSRFGADAFRVAIVERDTGREVRTIFPEDETSGNERARIDPNDIMGAIRGDRSVAPDGSLIVAVISSDGRQQAYLAIARSRLGSFDERAAPYAAAAAQIAALVLAASDAADLAAARSQEVRMLLATARALSSERDLQRLFARFHELVAGVMNAETFFIALGSLDTGRLVYPYAVEHHHRIEIAETHIDASVAGHVFKKDQAFLLNAPDDWNKLTMGYRITGDDVTSAIFAPMRIGRRTIGVISVQSRDSGVYSDRDRDLLVAIAEQAAIAVESSQHLAEAERRAKELNLLAEVSKALSRNSSLKELCRTVCREVRQVVDAPAFFVALRSGERELRVEYAVEDDVEKDVPEYSMDRTIAESVITNNRSVILRTKRDWETQPHRWLFGSDGGILSLVMVPLRIGEQCVGVMTCQTRRENAYDQSSARLIESIGEQLALAVENSRLYNEATSRADRDPLTNVFHHRFLKSRLDDELTACRIHGRQTSVIMLDVDNFKLVNDTYGHLVGDDALKLITSALVQQCRRQDIVGRYGGDEFMAILPDADVEAALRVAGRIESELSTRSLSVPQLGNIPVRCSIGVATFPIDGKTSADIIAKADARLYQSKRQGLPVGREQRIGVGKLRLTGNFEPVGELLAALLARDPATREHLEHVNRVALDFSRLLRLKDDDTQALLLASVLHDVGKIAIPDETLRKPGPLTPTEAALVERHPSIGAILIEYLPGFAAAAEAVRHHHERFDGAGYPNRLAGVGIPKLARIVTIIDAFSAMTVDRPYHKRRTIDEAIGELRRGAGSQFDPALVEKFAELIHNGGGR